MIAHHEHRIWTEQAIKDLHVFQWNLSSKLISQFLMITGVDVFVETIPSYFNLFDIKMTECYNLQVQ